MKVKTMKRFGWGLGDQALSSLTNFALGVLVATSVSTHAFGEFNLVFATYLLVLGISRALATEPLVIRYTTADEEAWREAASSASGTALAVSAFAGAICIVGGLVVGGDGGRLFVVLGLLLPGLLVQDSWRFVFFSRARGAQAVMNDLGWTVLLLTVASAVHFLDYQDVGLFIICWGGAAGFASVYGMYQLRLLPRPSRVLIWWGAHRGLSVRLATQFVATSGISQASVYAITLVAGATALGSLRGAYLLLGPIQVLVMGVGLVAVPEGARALRSSRQALKRLVWGVSSLVGASALGWGAIAYNLPESWGRAILGVTWDSAQPLVIPTALAMVASGLTAGATSGIRALGAADRSLRGGVAAAVVIAVGAITGAVINGAAGCAWGTAAGAWTTLPIWWRQFSRALSEHGPSSPLEPSVEIEDRATTG